MTLLCEAEMDDENDQKALLLTAAEREALIVASIELNALACFEDRYSHTLRELLSRCATSTR